MIKQLTLFSCLLFFLNACTLGSEWNDKQMDRIVHNMDEFEQAAENAQPGTTIVLANGSWVDAELSIHAFGKADSAISIQAETPGEVILTGESSIAFSGEYITISGLVFKNGFTPTSEVISFKTSKENLANHCRVTNCVIDNFTNPERFDSDTWVAIYGKKNRFDHNSLIGKGNRGVTLAVRLPTEASRKNDHVIEYNYFGPRQTLGSNGGESFRIGTSHYSRTYSNTLVQNNYFDRTSGELEIISNKSCGNKFLNNVFYECKGTLTMRHGHHTTVENNYFLGNRKPNTGGIRVINEYQTVKNNYLYGLTGYRFRSALVMMNGVPNSPINRYNQVIDSKIENNLVIDSDNIQFCAGSDEERSAIPKGSSFSNNILFTQSNPSPFTVFDDISGISFQGNIVNSGTDLFQNDGFEEAEIILSKNATGLLSPKKELLDKIGFGELKLPVTLEEVGASFYTKPGHSESFNSGKTITVERGTNTLLDAINLAESGDILELKAGGVYLLTKYASITKAISIVGATGEKAVILSEKGSFFKIENGGALLFENVIFDGAESPDRVGNSIVTTSKYSMNHNYSLVVLNCEVKDLDKNHTFNFLRAYKHTFADSIVIRNTTMSNITGDILRLDLESEDLGIYNAERVFIENSSFTDVEGSIANIYRGGTDESTFGPIVNIHNVEIVNCGQGKRNKSESTFRFHGVQKLKVQNVKFESSNGIDLHHTNGEPISRFSDLSFNNSGEIRANDNTYTATNISVTNK